MIDGFHANTFKGVVPSWLSPPPGYMQYPLGYLRYSIQYRLLISFSELGLMLLSEIARVTYSYDKKASLCVPKDFLSMINVIPENKPEVFAYLCEVESVQMPVSKQLIFSPIKLSPDCALCRATLDNKPGSLEELTYALQDHKINIMKIDSTSIGKMALVEMYLDFSRADIQTDGFAGLLENLKARIIYEYSTPAIETLNEICPAPSFKKFLSRLRITPLASNRAFAQIKLNKEILESLKIDWFPSKQQRKIKSGALVSTYSRFPMLIWTPLRPRQVLVRVRANLRDMPGALDETLRAVKDLITIYASDVTQFKGDFTSWDAIAFLLPNAKRDDVERALHKIEDEKIDKDTIQADKITIG